MKIKRRGDRYPDRGGYKGKLYEALSFGEVLHAHGKRMAVISTKRPFEGGLSKGHTERRAKSAEDWR